VARMRQRGEMLTGSWSANLKESGHLKPTRIFGKLILLSKIDLQEVGRKKWTALISSRIGTDGGLL
jgi:hypothetical protein